MWKHHSTETMPMGCSCSTITNIPGRNPCSLTMLWWGRTAVSEVHIFSLTTELLQPEWPKIFSAQAWRAAAGKHSSSTLKPSLSLQRKCKHQQCPGSGGATPCKHQQCPGSGGATRVCVDHGSLFENIHWAPSLAWCPQGERACASSLQGVLLIYTRGLLDISLDTLETLWLISEEFLLIT